MAAPPPIPGSAASPIDRTLSLWAGGDTEDALRHVAALVKGDLDAPVPLFVMACLLAESDRTAEARSALEICADRATDLGNLPVAVAAFAKLRELGVDASARVEAAAKRFGRGSALLKAGGPRPPGLLPARDGFKPLGAALARSALLDEASQIVDYAKAALEDDRSQRSGPEEATPQRLFSALSPDAGAKIMQACEVRLVDGGETFITEGETGAEAYIVARGELEVTRHGPDGRDILLARLGNGALLGEMSLLSRTPRAASVSAARPTILLVLSQAALAEVASQAPDVAKAFASYCRRRMVENLVRTSPILNAFDSEERRALMEAFVAKSFEKGDRIIAQGETTAGLHLIASGGVSIVRREDDQDEPVVIARLGVGDVVGEVAMVLRRPANADVVADHPTVTMHLPQGGFMDLIRAHPTLLSRLYELAIERDEETSNIVAQEATEAEDLIL